MSATSAAPLRRQKPVFGRASAAGRNVRRGLPLGWELRIRFRAHCGSSAKADWKTEALNRWQSDWAWARVTFDAFFCSTSALRPAQWPERDGFIS
jgi:hypothetical protein